MTLIYSANGRHLLDHNPALKVPYYKLDADKLLLYSERGFKDHNRRIGEEKIWDNRYSNNENVSLHRA